MTSILLVDDETDFHEPFVQAFEDERSSDYEFTLTETGLQGLRQARKIIEKEDRAILVVDLILPDFSGENLIQILDKELKKLDKSDVKIIVISAHKTLRNLRDLRRKYSIIHECLPKPIDTVHLKSVVDKLCGKPLKLFDYLALDTETADYISQRTQEIKTWMKQTAVGAIEAGEKIIQIKKILEHGQFTDWVRLELGCTHSTVMCLMRAARVFGEEKERIASSGLSLSVVYLLAQNNSPPELREEVLSMGESGSSVSYHEAKRLQRKYRSKDKNKSSSKNQELTNLKTINPETLTNSEISTQATVESNSARLEPQNLKQEIIQVIPQESKTVESPELNQRIWYLGDHLLFCGYPKEETFLRQLPDRVALILAFPSVPDWHREDVIPVASSSVNIFHTLFTDLNPDILYEKIRQTIELCTEGGDDIVISFLPDFNILSLANSLGCRCFIAEPDLEKIKKVNNPSLLARGRGFEISQS